MHVRRRNGTKWDGRVYIFYSSRDQCYINAEGRERGAATTLSRGGKSEKEMLNVSVD